MDEYGTFVSVRHLLSHSHQLIARFDCTIFCSGGSVGDFEGEDAAVGGIVFFKDNSHWFLQLHGDVVFGVHGVHKVCGSCESQGTRC